MNAGRLPDPQPSLNGPIHRWREETILGLLLSLIAYIASMSIVFRDAIVSGFDLGFGDRADGLIEISLLEHWRSVFTRAEVWNQPLYFHPYAGTLGYNDGYFLSGLIYSVWRLAFDPFIADTLTAFTYKSIGYAATLWLVRGVLRWNWGAAILIASLATISNNMFVQSGHAQVQTLALLPLVASFAILAVRAERDRRRGALLWAASAAAVMGAWLLTAFYFAWFAIYFVVVLAGCWLGVAGIWRPAALRELAETHWRSSAVFAGVFALAAIPFLRVYLPKARETGGHDFILLYTVQPIDLLNVGERNLLWGWLIRGLDRVVQAQALPDGWFDGLAAGGEHITGFPLLTFVLLCSAVWRVIRGRDTPRFARIFALAIAIGWALTLRFGPMSPWALVHDLIPGARGLRVVLRYQLFLVLPALLLIGIAFRDDLTRLWRRRPWIAGAVVALLVVEQLNAAQPTQLSRAAQLTAFAVVPPPPKDCASFYVVAARRGELHYGDALHSGLYPHNVDAMFLAEQWGVPTINGFSTFNPPDWNFATPEALNYDARVIAYAQQHGLQHMCRLDMRDPVPWRQL